MRKRTHQQYGFTLLEIMLVIFLMGMTVSGVIMTLSSANSDNELKKQAARFVGMLELAEEEALVRSLEIGIVIDEQQYQFVYLDDKNRWQEFEQSTFFNKVEMPEDISLSFELAGLKAEGGFLGKGSLFDNKTLFEDDDGLFDDKKAVVKITPQIFIYSSGEVTDFSLIMSAFDADSGSRELTIQYDEFGELVIESVVSQ